MLEVFRTLLTESQAAMAAVDPAAYGLKPYVEEVVPTIGGPLDCKDRWESVNYLLRNTHGVVVELDFLIEFKQEYVYLTPRIEAYYATAEVGRFPVHRIQTSADGYTYTEVPSMETLKDIVIQALEFAATLTPEDVSAPSWINVILGEMETQ